MSLIIGNFRIYFLATTNNLNPKLISNWGSTRSIYPFIFSLNNYIKVSFFNGPRGKCTSSLQFLPYPTRSINLKKKEKKYKKYTITKIRYKTHSFWKCKLGAAHVLIHVSSCLKNSTGSHKRTLEEPTTRSWIYSCWD